MRVYRFRQVKVKVGIAGHDDVARLRAIRRLLRRSVDLRVDANEAWAAGGDGERIRELEPFGISAVEQPVPHAEVGVLAEVRAAGPHADHARRIAVQPGSTPSGPSQDRTCDLFNLRLSKCGGFIPSLRLAQLARRHGLGYQLGCQVGETALLSAAGRHFASSVAGLRYLEGLLRPPSGARSRWGMRDITFGWGGRAPALPGPGLGVDLDSGGPGPRHRSQGGDPWMSPPRILSHTASDGYGWKYRRYDPPGDRPCAPCRLHPRHPEPRRLVQPLLPPAGRGRASPSPSSTAAAPASTSRTAATPRASAACIDDIAEFLREGTGGTLVTTADLPGRHLLGRQAGGGACSDGTPGWWTAWPCFAPASLPSVRPPFRERLGILWSYLAAPRQSASRCR